MMNFCSSCGEPVVQQIPADDNRLRAVCTVCQTIHYENPKIIAGALAHQNGKILLAKRAIEPRYGLWTLPAGFMECGETTEQAAQRETQEEACAEIDIERLLLVASIPQISQVYMIYQAKLLGGHAVGAESLATELYSPEDIPWDELAFPVMTRALQFYLDGPPKITHDIVIQRKKA